MTRLTSLLMLAALAPLAHAEDPSITLVVMNIHAGAGRERLPAEGAPREVILRNLIALASLIRQCGAQAAMLQEVDFVAPRSGLVDQAEALGRMLGWPHLARGINLDTRGKAVAHPTLRDLRYGIATISAWPLHEARNISLPSPSQEKTGEARSVLVASLELPSGDKVTLLNTHLSHEDGEARLAQARAILKVIEPQRAILAGDLNMGPKAGQPLPPPLEALLKGGYTLAFGPIPPPTFPSWDPQEALDHVLVGKGLAVKRKVILENKDLSDHLGLCTEIALKGRNGKER